MNKKCIECGKDFVPLGRALSCSKECAKKRINNIKASKSADSWAKEKKARGDKILVCGHCGDSYKRADGFPKYCSVKCRKGMGSAKGNQRRRAAKKSALFFECYDFLDIFNDEGGSCSMCGCDTPLEKRGTYADDAPEVDHIIPLSRGGHHARFNLQLICRKCNLKKGSNIYDADLKKAKAMWPDDIELYIKSSKQQTMIKGAVKYRGVCFDKRNGKYKAAITYDGIKRSIGLFGTAEAAAEAYNAEALRVRGANAFINEVIYE